MRPSGRATFLKVMVHSMSSPANTVESFHCTNTRMFDADMVRTTTGMSGTGCSRVGSSSGAAVKRHDYCRQLIVASSNRRSVSIGGSGWTDVKQQLAPFVMPARARV